MLVLLLCGMSAAAGVDASAPAEKERLFAFGAWIELSAEGRVTDASLTPDTTLPTMLREPLLQNIAVLVFEPARGVDGVAKPSRSWLQGRLRLVPQGDDYQLIVEAGQLGPRPLKPFRPLQVRPSDKPVRLLVTFDVTAEGRTRNVEVTAMDRTPSGMAGGVANAVKALRFDPEQVDGQPVPSTLRWPIQTRRSTSEELAFDLPPQARDPQRPGVPGQDAYAEPIIFTAVFKGTISVP